MEEDLKGTDMRTVDAQISALVVWGRPTLEQETFSLRCTVTSRLTDFSMDL